MNTVYPEIEKSLIRIWLSKKYWSASCEDEAIDLVNQLNSGHYNLSLQEIAEYTQWRSNFLRIVNELADSVGAMNLNEIKYLDFLNLK